MASWYAAPLLLEAEAGGLDTADAGAAPLLSLADFFRNL